MALLERVFDQLRVPGTYWYVCVRACVRVCACVCVYPCVHMCDMFVATCFAVAAGSVLRSGEVRGLHQEGERKVCMTCVHSAAVLTWI